jgi:hypothetical protein
VVPRAPQSKPCDPRPAEKEHAVAGKEPKAQARPAAASRALRRSFEVDVLACPGCGGRLRVLGEVTDPAMVRLVLDSLGMPTDAPRVARARDPTEWLGEHGVS